MVQGEIPTDGFYRLRPLACRKGQQPENSFPDQHRLGSEEGQVNQRRDGGVWMRLGAYKMNAGNRYSVRVAGRSTSEGRVVADAVMVVAGTQAAPQAGNDGTSSDGGPPATRPILGRRGDDMDGKAVDSEVIERARTHLGTPYMHSPPMPCTAYLSEDCSCFTSLVFSEWVTMPDNPVGQWYMGDFVEKSDLLPGDLVFFRRARTVPHNPRGHLLQAAATSSTPRRTGARSSRVR